MKSVRLLNKELIQLRCYVLFHAWVNQLSNSFLCNGIQIIYVVKMFHCNKFLVILGGRGNNRTSFHIAQKWNISAKIPPIYFKIILNQMELE